MAIDIAKCFIKEPNEEIIFKYFYTSIYSTHQIEFPMSEQSLYAKFTRTSNIVQALIKRTTLRQIL